MTDQNRISDAAAGAGPDARLVANAIESGWIGRGFKLGIGFFLAGLLVWLIPVMLLASCVATVATVAGGAAFERWAEHWEHDDRDEGEPIAVQPATPADAAAARAAAETAAADAAAVRPPSE